jgi:hypothetical protein
MPKVILPGHTPSRDKHWSYRAGMLVGAGKRMALGEHVSDAADLGAYGF